MQVNRNDIIELLRGSHLFISLSPEQIEKVADRVEAFLYQEKQVIFEQDAPVESFYFLLSGRVELVRHERDEEVKIILSEQDYFGEEALADTPPPRLATATALTNVIVLRFNGDLIEELKKEYPKVDAAFRLVAASYQLAMRIRMPWRGPREVVHYIGRHHPIFLVLRLILPVILALLTTIVTSYLDVVLFRGSALGMGLLLLVVVVNVAWLAWVIIDFYNDYSVVTNRRVAYLRKILLIYDSRQEVPLDAVLADDVRTTQLGRIIGYGDIVVRTYTGELILSRLAQPYLIVNLINEMREKAKASRKRARLESIDQIIRRRLQLGADEPIPQPTAQEVKAVVKSGKLTQFLSDLFMLRVEKDGAIIYRTHWFILLKKTLLPLILSLVVLAAMISIFFGVIPLPPVLGLVIGVLFLPITLIWLVYNYVDWRNDRYIITRDTIIDVYKKPLGTEQKRSAPLKNILSIDFERLGLIGLILNFGTVYIRVGDSTLTFNNVMAPSEVQRELFQRFMEFKQREEERAEASINEQLADWIEEYHRMVQGKVNGKNPTQLGENS
ncbi:cyclic nucleotide-binding domain-containing protein [Bellilinea sp.]|uniref:cyclic nucleotide-binding domain-containing protein n=1 Tax=Bellilinea sp. TaxID=2838785 RepID=UPI002ADE0990|nr:cyclic nucleotide-binding domain-containing protein [Bellilinea sp.]